MTTAQHYRHVRSLGAFPAVDCLRMARQAAALDHAAELRRLPLPVTVWVETLPDGSQPLRFSNGITVY